MSDPSTTPKASALNEEKAFTLAEVSSHTAKKDVYLIIHEKVYNASSFVDEHPGGEEVLLDVGGQDATEAFEDVGHSDEAREILDGMYVGVLKRGEGDPPPPKASSAYVNAGPKEYGGGNTSLGVGLYALVLLGGIVGFGVYKYVLAKDGGVALNS